MTPHRNKDGRYLIEPLGLSYDNIEHAVIVSTRRENVGSKVLDRQSGKYLTAQELKAVLVAVKPVSKKVAPPTNNSFNFESMDNNMNNNFTLLNEIWGDRDEDFDADLPEREPDEYTDENEKIEITIGDHHFSGNFSIKQELFIDRKGISSFYGKIDVESVDMTINDVYFGEHRFKESVSVDDILAGRVNIDAEAEEFWNGVRENLVHPGIDDEFIREAKSLPRDFFHKMLPLAAKELDKLQSVSE